MSEGSPFKNLSAESLFPKGAGEDLVRRVIFTGEAEFFETILPLAERLRVLAFDDEISFCSIVNAKSGACVETCHFCSQSASFKGSQSPVYPLMSAETILKKAKEAESLGGTEFSIVTSG